MKKTWKLARQGQKEFGGKVIDYLKESMSQVWADLKNGLEVVCYTKKEDDYKQGYYQIITGTLKEKANKKTGEPYYSGVSITKGFRNFKFVDHQIKISFSDLKDIENLMKEDGTYEPSL